MIASRAPGHLILALLAGAACTTTRAGNAPAPDDALAIDRTANARVAGAAAREGLLELLAEDGVFLFPGAPIARGRDAARQVLPTGAASATGAELRQPVRGEISQAGDLAYTLGYSAPRDGGDDRAPRPGKYISVWRRAADGRWQLAAHVVMGRPPGPVPDSLLAVRSRPMVVPVAGAPAPTLADVLDADRRFAAAAARGGAGAAFGDFAAPDAVMPGSRPGMDVGPDAIRRSFATHTPEPEFRWQPVLGGIAASSDLAWTVGEAEIRDPASGDVVRTKYLTVWKRQPSGEWKFVTDGGNRRP